MSESIPSPEKSAFKAKHNEWVNKVTKIGPAPFILGGVGGVLGYSALTALGFMNPVGLMIGGALAAIASYDFAKKNLVKG